MTDQDDREIQEHTIRQLGLVVERDGRGKIISSYRPNPFVIDRLFEMGIIDREQHWHAEQFVAMRKVFLRPVATLKTVTVYHSDADPSPPAKYPIADNDCLIVLRDMSHEWQKQIVRLATDDHFDTSADALFAIAPPRISDAFWAMTYAINRLLDPKKAADDAKKVVARTNGSCEYRGD